MHRSWLTRTAHVASIALVAAAGASLIARPQLGDNILAWLNDPIGLPSLAEDPRIHFQPPVAVCARDAAAMLPEATARVASLQGRPFARAPIVGVYASFDDYARANGLGDAGVAAVSRGGRVILSPTLCAAERDRLEGVLTHELSHAHFFGWRTPAGGGPVPSWFSEGLAVMVSNGGAAEGVDAAAAAEAVRQGYAIVVDDDSSWIRFADIAYEREPPQGRSSEEQRTLRQRLAYREAAAYVSWLRASDAAAFARLLDGLEDGAPFRLALQQSYGFASAEGFQRFRATLPKQTEPSSLDKR
ncbi:MAG TPA: hypothetical protein VK446_15200 [Methylocystis sp.]|nr:hypothetical protein [Methylocystis sp.]